MGPDYWKNVINLNLLAEKGAIAMKDRDLFRYVDTPEEAFEILKAGLIENHIETSHGRCGAEYAGAFGAGDSGARYREDGGRGIFFASN